MKLSAYRLLPTVALLAIAQMLALASPAQATNSLPQALRRPPVPALPPPAPTSRSPITFFSELLAMSGAERKAALTNYTADRQIQILQKVREYEMMKPDDRELRLRVTELGWYLRPLMGMPITNRAAQLAMIPPPNRSLVESRLREWDKLPPEVQKELLGLEPTLQYYAEIEGLSEQQKLEALAKISPHISRRLQEGIRQWQAMPEEQRQKTLSRFDQFFKLTLAEKDKALKTLSYPERRQIEKTLLAFGNLPPAERARCIRSFDKFTSLSIEERQEFLRNADRWKAMPPSERQAWRQLVNRLPPPLPTRGPPLPPPLLPHRHPSAPAVATTTN
jgi:hypothetical protein